MRISFIRKVITVANNASLWSTILVVFLEFILVDRAEISHMNTPQISSRNRVSPVTGSYVEALRPTWELSVANYWVKKKIEFDVELEIQLVRLQIFWQ